MIAEVPGLKPRAALCATERAEMFALLTRHFAGVSREQFERDLDEKNWAVQIRREGRLVGFSTLLLTETEFAGRALSVLYSGDTIVAPEAWGSPALARTWIQAVNALRGLHSERPCYWLLLTSGFRTYRFLPVFWREFYPCVTQESKAPPLLAHLARAQYGTLYDEAAGVVRFPCAQRLRGKLAELPVGRMDDSHVAFFLARNSRHAEGEELVCLTEICAANLTPAGRRMVR